MKRLVARLRRFFHRVAVGCHAVDVRFRRDDGSILDNVAMVCTCPRVFYVPSEVRGWIEAVAAEVSREPWGEM